MGAVNITLANGQLGANAQTNDGVVGLICTGGLDDYTLGDPLLITSMANAAAQGVTVEGSPFLYRQLDEFYSVAGSGAQIYVLPLVNTVTLATMADEAPTLLNYAAGKIKVLGLTTDDTDVYGGAPTITAGINADVPTLLAAMKTVATTYFEAQQPFRFVVGATSYAGVPGDLADYLTGTTNNRGALLLADTGGSPDDARDQVCMGLFLGRVASVPVMRKVSRVKDGALPNLEAYVGAIDITDPAHTDDCDVIAGKGFITWKKYPNVAGFFFSGDDTASATTDDYHFLARGRVIDKAHVLAYTTFVQEVDDEVLVNADGTLDAGFCKWLSTQIENSINNTMTANREISSVTCFIDPAQNILSTNTLAVNIGIVPVGYASVINVTLGFVNPAL